MKAHFPIWIFLVALEQGLWAQDAIRLKTRTLGREGTSRQLVPGSDSPAAKGHYIVQFQQFPDLEVRQELIRRGQLKPEVYPEWNEPEEN